VSRTFRDTIRLIIDRDSVGPICQSRELWSLRISPAALLNFNINLAATRMTARDVAASFGQAWKDGISAVMVILFPLQVGYLPG